MNLHVFLGKLLLAIYKAGQGDYADLEGMQNISKLGIQDDLYFALVAAVDTLLEVAKIRKDNEMHKTWVTVMKILVQRPDETKIG